MPKCLSSSEANPSRFRGALCRLNRLSALRPKPHSTNVEALRREHPLSRRLRPKLRFASVSGRKLTEGAELWKHPTKPSAALSRELASPVQARRKGEFGRPRPIMGAQLPSRLVQPSELRSPSFSSAATVMPHWGYVFNRRDCNPKAQEGPQRNIAVVLASVHFHIERRGPSFQRFTNERFNRNLCCERRSLLRSLESPFAG